MALLALLGASRLFELFAVADPPRAVVIDRPAPPGRALRVELTGGTVDVRTGPDGAVAIRGDAEQALRVSAAPEALVVRGGVAELVVWVPRATPVSLVWRRGD